MLADERKILAALKQSRYLATVPDDSLRKFLPLIRQAEYPAGKTIIAQGETNREVFIILKGSVSVKSDQRQLYSLGRTGDIFGEMTVVTGQPSYTAVEVLEELETLVVSSALLQEVKEDNSHELSFLFYDWVARILADKLHLTSEKAKQFEDASAELRESLAVQQRISETLRITASELEVSKAELIELNNLKTELIGIASHDLRSPISSVITVMETIPTCYDLDAELIELLKEVKNTCNEQLTLVNDLLDLAKIESGRLQLEATSFSYPQLLSIFSQVEKRARLLSRSKQLTVSLELAAALEAFAATAIDPLFISFDVPKVQQVLNNLIGNAIKFTPNQGDLKLKLDLDNSQNLLVSVSDSGLGIPAEEQAQVFDKFHQVKRRKTGTNGEKGTGLGLAICKNMVELHNGRIWVESTEGAGSTFTFSLPLGR
ncbi:MAG TPA: ATP-binding protein [Malonomonas sp.]